MSAAPWPRVRPALRSGLRQLRLAASFLTILPLGGYPASASELADSFGWFPLIGFALGAVLVVEDFLLAFFIAGSLRAVLIVLTLAVITGAVHLDGLGDTADALGAGRDRARALEILRDSRIGSFGTVAIVLVLALKITALASATGHARRLALYMAPGLARWAMVAVPYRMSYLREQGAGSTLLGIRAQRNLRLATIIAVLGLLPVAGGAALRALICALIAVVIIRIGYRRWLAGVTGDLLGGAAELLESALMVAIVS